MTARVATLRRWVYAASDEAATEAIVELARMGLGPVPTLVDYQWVPGDYGEPDEWREREAEAPDESGQVAPEYACPYCQTRDMEALIWREDGSAVYCATCGLCYLPGGAR